MRTYLGLLANVVRSALRSKHDLVLKNLALRQQLAVLTRRRARTRTRPADRVLLAVLWRLRYKLSFRDVAEMLLQRGFAVTHETVREWEFRFAPLLTEQLRAKRRGRAGVSWYLDETYLKVVGRWCYLYRAIDRDGALIDSMLSVATNTPREASCGGWSGSRSASRGVSRPTYTPRTGGRSAGSSAARRCTGRRGI